MNKLEQFSEKAAETGDTLNKVGNSMMGCGCLLTIFITIPILIFIFLL
ncbi:hypothetical protein [Gracilibacillus dipsosauri]